jgi:hypothetical protein
VILQSVATFITVCVFLWFEPVQHTAAAKAKSEEQVSAPAGRPRVRGVQALSLEHGDAGQASAPEHSEEDNPVTLGLEIAGFVCVATGFGLLVWLQRSRRHSGRCESRAEGSSQPSANRNWPDSRRLSWRSSPRFAPCNPRMRTRRMLLTNKDRPSPRGSMLGSGTMASRGPSTGICFGPPFSA